MEDLESLRASYHDVLPRADRLKNAVIAELLELFQKNGVALGVPIESRVKAWASIAEKLERKHIGLSSIYDLTDLVGIRVILLFKKDLDAVRTILSQNFELISSEDTGERLGESEFGYQSHHYLLKIPANWLSVPTWSGFGGFTLEFQVRTMAQHIWAAASHKLQYKQESGVPHPIRRSINRVSALLETVDLEIQRVLDERDAYKGNVLVSTGFDLVDDSDLNVDNLALILSEIYPRANRAEFENYSDLLSDMLKLGVKSQVEAREIFRRHYGRTMAAEKMHVISDVGDFDEEPDTRPAGVYFKHVGLAREALRGEFGEEIFRSKQLTTVSG